MRELFIYYRIKVAGATAALAAARDFQARLRERHPGLTARLLRRPDDSNGTETWMEIYSLHDASQPNGITPALEAEIAREAAALDAFIAGTRHTEAFVPCAS